MTFQIFRGIFRTVNNSHFLIAILFCLFSYISGAQDIELSAGQGLNSLAGKLEYALDENDEYHSKQVLDFKNLEILKAKAPNLGVNSSSHWIRFKIYNTGPTDNVLELTYPILDELTYFLYKDKVLIDSLRTGQKVRFSQRVIDHQNFVFNLPNEMGHFEVLLKVRSGSQIIIPLEIKPKKSWVETRLRSDLFFGAYVGIFLVMFLYNLFVYFSTKDKNYLYYIFYILTVCFTQIVLKGYGFKFLWPNSPEFAEKSVYLGGAVSGIAVIIFVRSFLRTKEYVPKVDFVFKIFFGLYIVSLILAVFSMYSHSLNLINFTAGLGSIILIVASIQIFKAGNRSALFFTVAWSVFLIAIIIFVLKDYNLLPYNNFTSNVLELGSSIEVILLSLALADRINVLNYEKKLAQENELNVMQENQNLIKRRNVELEERVKQRTIDLEESNKDLGSAMNELQDAQAKLVSNEKLVSLGHLTAGIAHEINNPINFVASNVNPLKRDLDDIFKLLDKYDSTAKEKLDEKSISDIEELKEEIELEYLKKEIDQLIQGIDDGAQRTAEIVKGLKNYSRIDEADFRYADIHEGIDSTLVILQNLLKGKVNVVKHYDFKIERIQCFPGKLNQVFANLITNSIQAIATAKRDKGVISIFTSESEKNVVIKIRDNGSGIPDELKYSIFDPFFTTKDVGEGTGLGLSIVHSIIEQHKGTISFVSEPGEYTEFKIELSKVLK